MKIIVIEGTDCSGKETQTKLLQERLIKDGYSCEFLSFPVYGTATGKIVGGPYLGKEEISDSYFEEGATSVDPVIASLYYAADRKYNIDKVLNADCDFYILDRYISSNLAHQGSKYEDEDERRQFYQFIDKLEYDLLGLPRAGITFLLHMPHEQAAILKGNRASLDQHEKDPEHLKKAEERYLELAKIYNWKTVSCVSAKEIRSREDINEEIYKTVITL